MGEIRVLVGPAPLACKMPPQGIFVINRNLCILHRMCTGFGFLVSGHHDGLFQKAK